MQNWNNILNYIKRNTGAKLNLLELSDDEILEGLQEDVMPYFSQYSPLKKYCTISENQKIPFEIDSGDTQWKYELPISQDEYIVDIYDVYASTGSDMDPFYDTKYASGRIGGSIKMYGRGCTDVFGGGIMDAVMNNEFFDIINSLSKVNTWEFFPPKTIRLDNGIKKAVVIYNTNHRDPSTIMPDFYNIMFKPLCLGNVEKWISALRSKYETLSTPMGEVRVNWQQLEQNAEKRLQETQQMLEQIMPDHFLSIE